MLEQIPLLLNNFDPINTLALVAFLWRMDRRLWHVEHDITNLKEEVHNAD